MFDVVPTYKPEGLTPLQLIDQFRKQFPQYETVKISPAGRLDPMAEGLMLLLIGDANKKRQEFLPLPKTYEFSILFGVTTDTFDVLGEITATDFPYQEDQLKQSVEDVIPTFRGKKQQTYPPYSSKPVNGKPLFAWARENALKGLELPRKEIEIFELSAIAWEERSLTNLQDEIVHRIEKVSGDFRQAEILRSWQNLSQRPQTLLLLSCKATVSSGTYIRGLCHELGQVVGVGGLAYTINRTQIGDYSLEDAISLSEQ